MVFLDSILFQTLGASEELKPRQVKKGAFQGDMMPKNLLQLKHFVQLAENSRSAGYSTRRWNTKGFGAGKAWSNGVVNYCFAEPW